VDAFSVCAFEVVAVGAERVYGEPVAPEEQMLDLVRVRFQRRTGVRTSLSQQLKNLLIPDAIEAALRLSAFAMAILHETSVRLRLYEVVAAEKADGVAASSQQ
jgi:hypothetical protein